MALTDPMNFEIIRDALDALLIANQGSLFRTITHQQQKTSADEVKGSLRTVQVYFSEGEFPRDKSSRQELEHEMTFQLILSASSPAKVDLATLNDDNASAAAIQAALLAMDVGNAIVDRLIDELYRIVTQILNDPVNKGLGLTKGIVKSAWFGSIDKAKPENLGKLAFLRASCEFTAQTTEKLIGATPVAAVQPTVDVVMDQKLTDNDDPAIDEMQLGVETEQ